MKKIVFLCLLTFAAVADWKEEAWQSLTQTSLKLYEKQQKSSQNGYQL